MNELPQCCENGVSSRVVDFGIGIFYLVLYHGGTRLLDYTQEYLLARCTSDLAFNTSYDLRNRLRETGELSCAEFWSRVTDDVYKLNWGSQ